MVIICLGTAVEKAEGNREDDNPMAWQSCSGTFSIVFRGMGYGVWGDDEFPLKRCSQY